MSPPANRWMPASGMRGKATKIVVLSGDGVGPEVTAEALKVLNAVAEGERPLSKSIPIGFVFLTRLSVFFVVRQGARRNSILRSI